MIKGFKEFISRGNVVELAVAVVMGAAFGDIVKALVSDIVTPLITAIFGKPNYANLALIVNNSKIMYGAFLNAIISFLTIAVGVYFLIVLPINKINERNRARRGTVPAQSGPSEIELLTDIRNALTSSRGDAS